MLLRAVSKGWAGKLAATVTYSNLLEVQCFLFSSGGVSEMQCLPLYFFL